MLITDTKKVDEYYEALVSRDESYVGIFFVGVRTTSIFCISTCRARKPKPENVEFYTSVKDALTHGYRPCKVCKPTQNANDTPQDVQLAIRLVKENPKEKITDQRLRENNIQPEKVRRWFNKTYGITYHAFQRMYRINNAYEELQNGKKSTDAAYDNGFESLSGFNYTYKKLLGSSPSKMGDNIIKISRTNTPLGPMYLCATEDGLCLCEFTDRRMLETEFSDLQRLLKATIIVGENDHIRQAKKELQEYFEGVRQSFDVELIHPASDFQVSVWEALKHIPYGKTSTYQKQANSMGKPKATRAVATANGCNRLAIIIPCHRIIGSDGQLRGYAGGLERKRWLLEHELKHTAAESGRLF